MTETLAATPILDALERAGIQRHELTETRSGRLYYATVGSTPLSHGWKLHVSSRAERYPELVSSLLADAMVRVVPFKLAADAETVDLINGGLAGDTQVGKVVTFYPESDAAARALGERLASMLWGWAGPVIENELRIQPRAPVFARYGSFQRRVRRTQLGLQMDVLESPSGELVRDVRGVPLHEALGVACPFPGATVASAPRVIGERFVLVGLMVETLHSKIYHAVDLQDCDACLVKLVRRHTSVARSGRDAADRMQAEYELLSELQMRELTRARAFHSGEDWAALAMTRFDGSDLLEWRRTHRSAAALRTVAVNIVSVLSALHERGVIVGDVNLRNVIVGEALEVSFVDLELATRQAGASEAGEFGTHGYRSPEVVRGGPVTARHDLYALAGVLLYLATGIELWTVVRSDAMLRELGGELPEPWRGALALLLGAPPPSTVATLRDVQARLLAAAEDRFAPVILRPARQLDHRELEVHLDRSARALLRLATRDDDGHPIWVSRHHSTRGQHYADLHLGDAGIALGLLRVGLAIESVEIIEAAVSAALGLAGRLARAEQSLPGLFVGDGGAALLFLSLHEVLGTPDWLDRTVTVSRQLASVPCPSPDLLHGISGLGLVHLWTYEYTRDDRDLQAALAGAKTLVEAAQVDSRGIGWRIPGEYGDLSGQQLYGMAHGTAGIVYFLNELLRVHPTAPVGAVLDQAIETLASARTHNPRIGATDWPHAPGGELRGGVWCHGAAGIAQSLGRVYARTHDPEILLLTEEAARAALLQAQWLGPTQCHGLAGLIEVSLDLHRATGNDQFVASAQALGARLVRYYTEETEFGPLASSERHDVFTAELMVGASGAAASLARLLDVKRWGSLLLPPRDALRPIRRD